MTVKEQLLAVCQNYASKRIASYRDEIETIKESIENNDKSNDEDDDSGNGKLFNDLEKNAQHLTEALKTLDTLKLINPKTNHTSVVLGSIVKTNASNFFISTSIGAIELEGTTYFGISLLSPIGQLLKNKVVGDSIEFNGNKHTIVAIK
ncbi:transcription elongation factor [Hanstruepera neustonica]|uniref:Transcription elongation factor n=1 Tax=Hanstruepera neustonica TaxID=1445657 RepID=A0A2K1DYF6_9FLAO|nr:transcription elongation factor [Hanstruepera neustonica]PNQ73057.1 transcription elongation factor [Hanstruepera neustonica]